ncbi:MAG: hypothetical protein CL677_05140 [Bdellovibrionaceae bacterium]|nr:hypothetical protein [Pseudobdellovibrionaceae bacterium]|tara:strand:+ start:87914 stop:88993 length:1080 start_codon:yes stop_codon:yes gene_type:complete
MAGLEKENQNTIQLLDEPPMENRMEVRGTIPSYLGEESRQRIIKAFDRESEASVQSGVEQVMGKAQVAEMNLLKNARLLVANTEYDLAMKLIRESLAINSKSGEAIKLLGQCFMGKGKVAEAIRCFRSLVDIETSFDSLSMLASAYYDQGDDHSALDFYMKSLEMQVFDDSLLFDIHKNIGNIYVKSGDFQSAREHYGKAYTMNPDSAALLVNFGTLEIQKNEWENAINFFRKAVTLDPSYDNGWMGLAIVHREYGDFELSWANIEKCLDYNPNNSVALRLALEWSFKDKKTSRMVSRLEDYLDNNSGDFEVSLLLANLYYELGQIKFAQIEINRSLHLNPENVEAAELATLIKQASEV